MSTHPHRYTFQVTKPAAWQLTGNDLHRLEASADAATPDEALAAVVAQHPSLTLAELTLVSPIGEGCADEHCGVCHPSPAAGGAQ